MMNRDELTVDIDFKAIYRLARYGLAGLLVLLFLLGGYVTVPAGGVGIPLTFGKIGSQAMDPGFHIKLPLFTSVIRMSTRLQTHSVAAPAASKDLQQVTAEVTVPFSLNASMAPKTYQVLGSVDTFKATIINPGVMESVKAVTAAFTAEELVTKREVVKGAIERQVKAYVATALLTKGLAGSIEIGSVAITHFDFSPDFNKSIEMKVKAEQDALRAENEKKQKVTEAEATRDATKAEADGEAYSIEVKSKSEAAAIQRKADALRANPNLIQLNAVDKWDGKLPGYMAGSAPLPFLSVAK